MGGAASWKADRESNPLFGIFSPGASRVNDRMCAAIFSEMEECKAVCLRSGASAGSEKRRGIPLVAHTRENVRLSAEFLWLRASEYHTHIGALHLHAGSEV